MSRREEITKLITMLAEAFGRKASAATFAAYELGLEGIDLASIKLAVSKALRTSQYMPPPSELRELSGEHKPEDRAQVAWLAVGDAMRTHGGYRTITFDDVVINAAVRSVGGWARVCEADPKEFEAHIRRDFMKAYTALCVTGVGEDQAAPLIGIFDRENAVLGYGPHDIRTVVTGLPPIATAPRVTNKAAPIPILRLKSSKDAG
jgi:hypothetical protein